MQCKKQGIQSVGIDANPVLTLASRIKQTWGLQPDRLCAILEDVLDEYEAIQDDDVLCDDTALTYLQESGMIERGWLSLHKAKKVLSLNAAIEALDMTAAEQRFFHLGLMSAVVDRIADIKFGPEVYCLKTPKRTHVLPHFIDCIATMIGDVEDVRRVKEARAPSQVHLGDSRETEVLKRAVGTGADFLITSPPYPAEHDYTRSTRLHLAGVAKDALQHSAVVVKKRARHWLGHNVYRGPKLFLRRVTSIAPASRRCCR